jgi:hypothetical protein
LEANRIADGDMPLANCRRSAGSQSEIRQGTKIASQCQRAITDVRRADADEFVAKAEIETSFENGFDICERHALAEFLRRQA